MSKNGPANVLRFARNDVERPKAHQFSKNPPSTVTTLPAPHSCELGTAVIARSEATKQSTLCSKDGLLRFARNDVERPARSPHERYAGTSKKDSRISLCSSGLRRLLNSTKPRRAASTTAAPCADYTRANCRPSPREALMMRMISLPASNRSDMTRPRQ
jgi:hypothetical protein